MPLNSTAGGRWAVESVGEQLVESVSFTRSPCSAGGRPTLPAGWSSGRGRWGSKRWKAGPCGPASSPHPPAGGWSLP